MATRNSYFPASIGNQVLWLRTYRNKIGKYETVLAYTPAEIAATVADADRVIYLLDTINTGVQSHGSSVSTHIKLMLNGPIGDVLVPLPVFTLPATPAAPANVLPGALKRIFAFIKNLKTRAGATEDVLEDLQIVGPEETEDPEAVPKVEVIPRNGEVLVKFSKNGHTGAYLESQIGEETAWSYLAIDTTSPYNDTRPLKVAGQPEKRRYRACFWDGDPTNVWTASFETIFGG